MVTSDYKLGRLILSRLPYNGVIPDAIVRVAVERNVEMGVFTLIGALKRAKLAYYNQREKEYKIMEVLGPQEIAGCIGNLSFYERKPFVHMHAVLADERGGTRGGHLLQGVIFAAELHLQELQGPKLERAHDRTTGLALWQKPRHL
jgi:hypothetical protein